MDRFRSKNEYYKTNVVVVNETVLAVWKHLSLIGVPILQLNQPGPKTYYFPHLPLVEKRVEESVIANQIAAWLGKNRTIGGIDWTKNHGTGLRF